MEGSSGSNKRSSNSSCASNRSNRQARLFWRSLPLASLITPFSQAREKGKKTKSDKENKIIETAGVASEKIRRRYKRDEGMHTDREGQRKERELCSFSCRGPLGGFLVPYVKEQEEQQKEIQLQPRTLTTVSSNSSNNGTLHTIEPPQRISLRLPINTWDRKTPEVSPATSVAGSASGVTSPALFPVAASTGATRLRKESAPSQAKELLKLELLMELPDRAAAARIDGNAAAEATGIVVTLTGNSRDRGANGSSRQLWGGSQSAMASTVPPSAAAATGTEAASGAIRHSPRTLHQQRLPAGTAATNAALASARRRVLVKQQQLLDYLDCISAGERLLREIQQQQQCPKRPTALSRLTGVLPQQQQHPEELRQQREQELMRLLWGRSEVQTKQKQEPVSKRQQKQQQRLKGTKRQLPTSALQRLFFRLQRKMKQLELVQDRQSAAQQLGKDPAKLRSLPRERKQEQQHREQQQQGQKLQECQQQLQNEQQNPLEQPQPPQQQQHHQLQQKGWRQQQQQMTWGFAQHQQELLQRGFGGCTFLTACEDTGGQPVSAAAAAAPANAHAAHRANLADFSPASVGVAASASVVLPAASAAQKCAGIAPPPPVVDAIKDVAAAARLARPAAADHTQLARDATNVPTAAIAIAALNAVSTPVNASGAPTNAATPPVHLLEGPTQSATGSCFSSRNNSRKCLLQQQTKGQQPQQQDLCMRLLDGQIEVFHQLLQISKCATLLFKTLKHFKDALHRNSNSS